jgi:hypothetical protein
MTLSKKHLGNLQVLVAFLVLGATAAVVAFHDHPGLNGHGSPDHHAPDPHRRLPAMPVETEHRRTHPALHDAGHATPIDLTHAHDTHAHDTHAHDTHAHDTHAHDTSPTPHHAPRSHDTADPQDGHHAGPGSNRDPSRPVESHPVDATPTGAPSPPHRRSN